MKVKICGLHPVRDVQLCIDLGVNFLGFVFKFLFSSKNLLHKLLPEEIIEVESEIVKALSLIHI